MSLGWQTESALLPKKAKPINVSDDSAWFNLQSSIEAAKGTKAEEGRKRKREGEDR